MTDFTVHTPETAPAAARPTLEAVKNAYGFLPNLFGVFAESPAIAEAYASLSAIFDKTDLTPTERQIILMSNNRLNECTYCMAAHTTISQMQGVKADVIGSLRSGGSIADPKLEALRAFAVRVHETRGFVSEDEIDAFLAAGYTKGNILDVILGASFKTLSNYTNHVADTPLDDAFKANAWEKLVAEAA